MHGMAGERRAHFEGFHTGDGGHAALIVPDLLLALAAARHRAPSQQIFVLLIVYLQHAGLPQTPRFMQQRMH